MSALKCMSWLCRGGGWGGATPAIQIMEKTQIHSSFSARKSSAWSKNKNGAKIETGKLRRKEKTWQKAVNSIYLRDDWGQGHDSVPDDLKKTKKNKREKYFALELKQTPGSKNWNKTGAATKSSRLNTRKTNE